MKHPPLYECSECGAAVDVKAVGDGVEPIKTFSCGHDDAIIWANRTVRLRGKGRMSPLSEAKYHVKVKLSQLLSALTKRSF